MIQKATSSRKKNTKHTCNCMYIPAVHSFVLFFLFGYFQSYLFILLFTYITFCRLFFHSFHLMVVRVFFLPPCCVFVASLPFLFEKKWEKMYIWWLFCLSHLLFMFHFFFISFRKSLSNRFVSGDWKSRKPQAISTSPFFCSFFNASSWKNSHAAAELSMAIILLIDAIPCRNETDT